MRKKTFLFKRPSFQEQTVKNIEISYLFGFSRIDAEAFGFGAAAQYAHEVDEDTRLSWRGTDISFPENKDKTRPVSGQELKKIEKIWRGLKDDRLKTKYQRCGCSLQN